jgi:deoxyribonuclease-4
MAGIEYGEKGEKHHLLLEDSDFNWKELLKTWKEFKIGGVVVCESPIVEKDALLMKKFYENL